MQEHCASWLASLSGESFDDRSPMFRTPEPRFHFARVLEELEPLLLVSRGLAAVILELIDQHIIAISQHDIGKASLTFPAIPRVVALPSGHLGELAHLGKKFVFGRCVRQAGR